MLAAMSGLDADRAFIACVFATSLLTEAANKKARHLAGLLSTSSKERLLLLLGGFIVHRLRALILLRIRRSGNRLLRFVGYLIFVGHIISFLEGVAAYLRRSRA